MKMGIHSNAYHKIARAAYITDWKPPDGDYAAKMDGSHVLYDITKYHQLGYRCFYVDPKGTQNPNITQLIAHYPVDLNAVASLVKKLGDSFVTFIKYFDKEKTTIYLEGSIKKPRHDKTREDWEAKINSYLKDYYKEKARTMPHLLKMKHSWMKRKISENYGRPPPWLTVLLAKELQERGYSVDYSADLENDFRICQDAKDCTSQQVFVVGNDSDFIGLSPPNSVTTVVNKHKGKWRSLNKTDILERLHLSDFGLALAFAITGCDNVQAHIKNTGWVKALRFAQASNLTVSEILNMDEMPLSSKNTEVKQKMLQEFKMVLENFGWLDYRIVPQSLPEPVFPQRSAFMEFIDDEKRSAVRKMLNNKYEQVVFRGKTPPKSPPIYKLSNTFSILRFIEETQRVCDQGTV